MEVFKLSVKFEIHIHVRTVEKVTQSLASMREPSSKFKLFSHFDGVLAATMHEKQKIFVHMKLYHDPENLSIRNREQDYE